MSTILLIDDSKTVQKAAQIALAKNTAFNLVVLGDANQALAKAQELSPDLILVDHMLAPRDGYDVAGDFKKDPALKNIPIVLLVGPNMRLDPQKAMTLGIVSAISKPFTVEHLVTSLQAVLTAAMPAPVVVIPEVPVPAAVPVPIVQTIPVPVAALAGKSQAADVEKIPLPPRVPFRVFAKGDLNPPDLAHLKPPASVPNLSTPALTEALSREAMESTIRKIIEEVVWEVVPGLAETLIKEELHRLLKS